MAVTKLNLAVILFLTLSKCYGNLASIGTHVVSNLLLEGAIFLWKSFIICKSVKINMAVYKVHIKALGGFRIFSE